MWSDMTREERIAAIKQMATEGLSFLEMAERLECRSADGTISRNIPLSFAHRNRIDVVKMKADAWSPASGKSGTRKVERTWVPPRRKPRQPGSAGAAPVKKVDALDVLWRRKFGDPTLAALADMPVEDEAPQLPPREPPAPLGVTLVGLTGTHCHWPLWPTPDWTHKTVDRGPPPHDEIKFCGLPALEGRPYCPYHESVATPRT